MDEFEGGDPPCWEHLLDEEGRISGRGLEDRDPEAESEPSEETSSAS